MNRVIACVIAAGLWAVLGGCSGAQKHSATSYSSAFERGRYTEAYDQSILVANSPRAGDKEQAALVAGLSAHALDRNADADKWLRPLLNSSDRAIAGKAGATLGLIEQERGSNTQAAALLTAAAGKLQGDEAARAWMYAGDSYAKLGRANEAKDAYQQASGLVRSDTALRSMVADRLAGAGPSPTSAGGYAVQVGAFSTRANAEKEARKYGSFGTPRIVEITDSKGRHLWAVRVGQFPSRDQANGLKKRMGASSRVVAASGE